MFTGKIYGEWMSGTQEEKLEKILEEVGADKLKGKNILDVGSGPGFLGRVLAGEKIISADIDLESLKKAKGLRVLASGDFLPFRKVFDAVFCIDAIHLLDKKRIAAEFAKVLKDNGILVVSAFCNKYSAEEKMGELESIMRGFEIKKRFLAKTESEWDAVVIARLK